MKILNLSCFPQSFQISVDEQLTKELNVVWKAKHWQSFPCVCSFRLSLAQSTGLFYYKNCCLLIKNSFITLRRSNFLYSGNKNLLGNTEGAVCSLTTFEYTFYLMHLMHSYTFFLTFFLVFGFSVYSRSKHSQKCLILPHQLYCKNTIRGSRCSGVCEYLWLQSPRKYTSGEGFREQLCTSQWL